MAVALASLYAVLSLWPALDNSTLFSEIIEQTRLHTTFVFVVVAVVLAAFRKWTAAGIVVCTIIGNTVWIASAYLSGPDTPQQASSVKPHIFRLLSFNAKAGNEQAKMISRAIINSGADYALLLEVTPKLGKDLEALLSERYPFHTNADNKLYVKEWMAFSKYPILTTQNYVQSQPQGPRLFFAPVDFQGTILDIYGVHAKSPLSITQHTASAASAERISTRSWQLSHLVSFIAATGTPSPVIVAGDMNSVPWHPSVRGAQAALGLKNANRLLQMNLTWPTWMPWPLAIPIDHIMHSRELCSLGSGTMRIEGSDHYAVYANLYKCSDRR